MLYTEHAICLWQAWCCARGKGEDMSRCSSAINFMAWVATCYIRLRCGGNS